MTRRSCSMVGGALAVVLLVAASVASAQPTQPAQPPCPPGAPGQAGAPEHLEGEVVAVDVTAGTLVVRTPDGQTHEFQGPPETIREYQVGDLVELNQRKPVC